MYFCFFFSRSGKTDLAINIIKEIKSIAKKPPEVTIFVYHTWQDKYEKLRPYVNYLIEDDKDLKEKIQAKTENKTSLVVLDDVMNSSNLSYFKLLFTVEARHQQISVVFLTQKMFTSDEYIRVISQNSDYIIAMANPRNSDQMYQLATQINRNQAQLIFDIYTKATEDVNFSYLLLDLTQTCPPQLKYRSHIFNNEGTVRVYVAEN